MKIGIACVNLSFVAGGPRVVFALARSLQELGHTVSIYAPDFDAAVYASIAEGLDIRIVPPPAPLVWSHRWTGYGSWLWYKAQQEYRARQASAALAVAMDDDLDVLNVHDFAYRVPYFYRKRNSKVRTIWTENAPPVLFLPKGKFLRDALARTYHNAKEFVNRKYFRAIDKVAVMDLWNKSWATTHGFTSVTVIRAGLDFQKFYAPIKDFKAKAGRKQVQLFAVGALNAYRRYDVVMRAVKLLRDAGYDATALIICNNVWKEDGVRADLLRLRDELQLRDAVTLRFDSVTNEELKRAYETSDILVQAVYVPPPGNHGFALVNFEGMAAGLPLIVCRASTVTEVLRDGETAFFIDPLSPEAIQEKVVACINDPELYRRIATAGQEFTREYISWDRYAKETLDLFLGA